MFRQPPSQAPSEPYSGSGSGHGRKRTPRDVAPAEEEEAADNDDYRDGDEQLVDEAPQPVRASPSAAASYQYSFKRARTDAGTSSTGGTFRW